MTNIGPFFTLLQGAEVFAPEKLGRQDVLIAGGKIAAIAPRLEVPAEWECRKIDLNGCLAVPGFIDAHVHLLGGGGEGGFATRTPEVQLGDVVRAGVTTVIGCLGTDGTTRHMTALLAKARGLEAEGVTTHIYTGSYEIPANTITRNVRDDIIVIDKVIGCGEVAISDHRSAQPTKVEIAKLAAESRVGGMLSAKAGVLQLHVGDGKNKLKFLFDIVNEGEIPITQFIPTHISRNQALLEEGVRFAKMGGVIDITSGVVSAPGMRTGIKPSDAVRYCIEHGVPLTNVTMSSDGNGSMPAFDADGRLIGLEAAKMDTLFNEIRDLIVGKSLEVEDALKIITENPAKALKLHPQKGCLKVGGDADVVILDKEVNIRHVFAKGRMMLCEGKQIVFGTFEKGNSGAASRII